MPQPYRAKSSAVNRILGIVLLLVAVLITLLIPYPSLAIRLSIYILFGFGIALVLLRSQKDANVSVKGTNIAISVVGGAAIPVILILLDPIGKFKLNQQEKMINTTVFVHGKKGPFDMVLRQQGYVIMEVNGNRQKQLISENGDAHFGNLQIGDKIRLDIDFSEPYHPVHRDSVYTVGSDGKIYLEVALEGIDKIAGIVLYNDAPLEGVIVTTGDLSDTTNSQGGYKIGIPEDQQSRQYRVVFVKEGFKVKTANAFPQTGQPLDVIMEKN